MTIPELLILLVIAAVCGALGQAIAGASRGGFLVSTALGFIGAAFGTWIARSLGLPELLVVTVDDVQFPIVWSVVGACLFVAVVAFLTRGSGRKRA